jgi:hypothetical protein
VSCRLVRGSFIRCSSWKESSAYRRGFFSIHQNELKRTGQPIVLSWLICEIPTVRKILHEFHSVLPPVEITEKMKLSRTYRLPTAKNDFGAHLCSHAGSRKSTGERGHRLWQSWALLAPNSGGLRRNWKVSPSTTGRDEVRTRTLDSE